MNKSQLHSSESIINAINNRDISCEELIKDTLDNISRYDSTLGCYITTKQSNALIVEARASDTRRQNNTPKSLIDGIPIAIKDNIHVMGLKTTCGSNILGNYMPPFDASVSTRIKESGGIIIGKTNLDEFGMGSTTESSAYGVTKNPFDITRVPGGSSGGSAASVAAGLATLALGSDTGGSIRQPAAFCGVTGLKPTYGRVSRYGLVSYASSFDQIGPLARDVYGCASMMNIIAGYDPQDATSSNATTVDYTSYIDKPIKKLRISVISDIYNHISPYMKEIFNKSLKVFGDIGATIDEIQFPMLEYAVATYYIIAMAECATNLGRYDGVRYGYRSSKDANYEDMIFDSRTCGFGKEVKKRIIMGNFALSSGYYDEYYKKAQKIRTIITNNLKNIFDQYDAILIPTTPDVAYKLGEFKATTIDTYLSDITTVIPNISGYPAISLPNGVINGLPAGLQIICKPFAEATLLQIGAFFEHHNDFRITPSLNF